MRNRTNVLAAFLALTLLVPAAATAQYDQGKQKERTQDKTKSQYSQHQDQQGLSQQGSHDFQPKLHQADDLIGATVKNKQGEDLGEIKELVMDSQHQNISYAVLAFGGFLGLGQDLRAIPWQALTIYRGDYEPGEPGMRTDRASRDRMDRADRDRTDHASRDRTDRADRDRTDRTDRDRYDDYDGEITVVLNATKEQLENAEGFPNDQWPDTGNERWTQNVHTSFFGEAGSQDRESKKIADRTSTANRQETDTRSGKEAMKSRRLSNIMGETVKNYSNEDIGKIETILIDVNRGDLAYVIVDVSDLEDLGDTEQVAIPWRSLQTRGDDLTMSLDMASLGRMNYEEEDGLRQLENRDHATERHTISMMQPYWQDSGDEDQRYGQGMQRGTEQSDRYGTQSGTTTITGKITRVMHETKQGHENLRFEVMTEDGRRIMVDAGQKSSESQKSRADQQSREGQQRYGQQSRDDQKQPKFEEGDQVTVTGTRETKGDGQATFKAQTVRSGSEVWNVQRTDQDHKRDKQ